MLKIKEFLGLSYYTSELDKFLSQFDANHRQPSQSQQAEINKTTRLQTSSNAMRDPF